MFTLDFQSRLPIYEQLYQSVIRMAAVGIIHPNDQLPPVRALAQELGINPNTVQKAYQMLERDGIICSVTGKGSFLSTDLSALNQKQELAKDSLRRAIQSAAETGMTENEIHHLVEHFFNEGSIEI